MFRTILRLELQASLYSNTLLVSLAVITALVLLSAYTQGRYYKQITEDYELRRSLHRAENSGEGVVIARELPALLPFFNGVYENLPDEFRLRRDAVISNPLSGDLTPLDRIFAKTDLSFIIGVLLTLTTLLLAHGAIAGDREQGTLKLVLAGPVHRRTVLIAKLTSVVVVASIILTYVVVLYGAMILFSSGGAVDLSKTNLLALGLVTFASLLLLTAAASFGVAVSVSVRQSSVSLALCASIWIGAVLIWPSFGPSLAASLKSVVPWETSQREIDLKQGELIQAELIEQRSLAAELKAQNAAVDVAWKRYLELRWKWMKLRNREIGKMIYERNRQIHQQQRVARYISSFSPYLAFKMVLGRICLTGIESYNDFLTSVERYERDEYLPASFELLSSQQPGRNAASRQSEFQLKPLRIPSPSLAQRARAVAFPLGLIALQAALLLVLGLYNFNRYEIR